MFDDAMNWYGGIFGSKKKPAKRAKVRKNPRKRFTIESRSRGGHWTNEEIGVPARENVFSTRKEAEAAIKSLRKIGPDWAAAEYRVHELSGKSRRNPSEYDVVLAKVKVTKVRGTVIALKDKNLIRDAVALAAARKNPRPRSKFPLFVVQTIEVPKRLKPTGGRVLREIDATEARVIAERHGGRPGGKIDKTENYYRFRQHDPKMMTRHYVSLRTPHAIVVKALPKDIARRAKVSNSDKPLTQAELKRLWALQDVMKAVKSVGHVSTKMPPMKSAKKPAAKKKSAGKKSGDAFRALAKAMKSTGESHHESMGRGMIDVVRNRGLLWPERGFTLKSPSKSGGKFWNVRIVGGPKERTVITEWGKIGKPAQGSGAGLAYHSQKAAAEAAEKLIVSKLKKNYAFTGDHAIRFGPTHRELKHRGGGYSSVTMF